MFSKLLSRLQQGEESAFKELVLTYSARLMTVAKVYSSNKEDAEDILQDAFIIIFQKVSGFQGDSERGFFGWMKKITINLAISKIRKNKRKKMSSVELTDIDYPIDSNILSNLHQEELMQLVFDLPSGYRQVFALFVIEGYSHKEIAEKLNISVASSRSNLSRAKEKLKLLINKFEQRGVTY